MAERLVDLDRQLRRMIIIASDEKVEEMTTRVDYVQVIRDSLLLAAPTVGGLVFLVHALAEAIGKKDYLAETVQFWSNSDGESSLARLKERYTKKIALPLPVISPVEAAAQFEFDINEPRDGAMYITHPNSNRNHYILPADFNKRYQADKYRAFLVIAGVLGAKEITISNSNVSSSKSGGKGQVDTGGLADVGIQVSVVKEGGETKNVCQTYGPLKSAPRYPEEEEEWIRTDEDLRQLVHNRLNENNRLMKSALNFRIRNSFELDVKLKGVIKKYALELGGEVTMVEEANYSFSIEFWPWD